jgi:hypothetical protein
VESTLDYASPSGLSAAMTRGALIRRRILFAVYFICWAGPSVLAGMFLGSFVGRELLGDRLGPLHGDDFLGVGAVLGLLLGTCLAWFGRRWWPLHVCCILLGLIGSVVCTWGGMDAYKSRGFLWEIGVAIAVVVGTASVMFAIAGVLGLRLSSRRRRVV